jgi:uncharacterized protein DUF3617
MLFRLSLLSAAVLTAAPAFTFDMPARKPGLWEIKIDFAGRNLPARTMQQCIDAATDKIMNAQFGGTTKEACAKQDIKNAAGTTIVDSVCKFGEATVTSHAVMTGSFDSAYTVDVTSTREGGRPLPGQTPGAETHMKIEAKWLGACAAGQRPGDIMMGNGMKMNILDLPKMGGTPPGPVMPKPPQKP